MGFNILSAIGIVLLGALAAVVTHQPEQPLLTSKVVTLEINGYQTQVETMAINVADLVMEEVGEREGLAITPDPATSLVAGDIVRVEYPTVAILNETVEKNLELINNPEPEPATPVLPKKSPEKTKPTIPPTPTPEPTPETRVDKPDSKVYSGLATWYRWGEGLNTASRDFPKGTKLRVVAINSGRTVDVVVNDYGPAEHTGVALDLNSVAFSRIAPLGAGKIEITYQVIK